MLPSNDSLLSSSRFRGSERAEGRQEQPQGGGIAERGDQVGVLDDARTGPHPSSFDGEIEVGGAVGGAELVAGVERLECPIVAPVELAPEGPVLRLKDEAISFSTTAR